ncbi:MAG: cytochrome c biogenesis protein CcdA [Bacteroidaceae bacterium]|nr:cytochrome c biogenesis protein CcdA [Bacteroidaceae bacterium]
MKKALSLISLFLLTATFALAQVNFNVAYKRVSPTEIDIVFTGKADRGWHIYSNGFGDGGPTQAEFSTDAKSGVELVGTLKPGAGEKKIHDPIFEMDVRMFEGTATFTQRVRLTEKNYNLKGYLTYGACNDQNCLPPTSVDCSLSGTDGPAAATPSSDNKTATAAEAQKNAEPQTPDEAQALVAATADSLQADTLMAVAMQQEADADELAQWYSPVTDELKAFGENNDYANMSLWYIFLLGFLGGLVALFTPCVWPIIPMTVSFFLKRSESKARGLRDAITYGISIVVIYVALGLLITAIFGANALNDLSTNAIFNMLFFLMLVVFAASFLGGFEITLPSSWSNAVDKKSESATGLLSIFLMAFTLALVSFSCTGPIIGFLLVEVSTSGGTALAPTIGMLGFAIALALPFTLFALFPTWLKSAPRSGGWMNTIKVVLGFLELAFALKFFSVADLAYGWHLLDRETFLALWIVIFALLGFYLLGLIKFPHDDPDERQTSVPRFFLALASIAFAVYMVPGLWGAPCKAVSAFAPPMSTQDFNLNEGQNVEAKFTDYEKGMAYAKLTGKPVMVDFTGFGCVNCRKMEMAVWSDRRVRKLLTGDYVLISLYVDDKTRLPEPIIVQENGKTTTLRTVGDRWSYLQRSKFGAQTQPFYVLLNQKGMPLCRSYSYDEDVDKYVDFLQKGLEQFRKQ